MTRKLFAGERFLLEEDTGFWQVLSGCIEVYATTQKGNEISFHQCYLAEKKPGSAIFPALDEFGEVNIQAYAIEDAEIAFISWQELEPDVLRPLMEEWFSSLVQVPWIRLLADKGDDMLQLWQKNRVLKDAQTTEQLHEKFLQHEGILALLAGVRFGAQDKRLARQLRIREKSRALLVENGIRGLLGEEPLYADGSDSNQRSALLKAATFAVRQVAAALSVPTESIRLEEDSCKNLDEVSLLRRLMQKGNMQMRLVTLPEDTFQPETHAKCCVVIFTKFEKDESFEGITPYSIFMCETKWCGHDSRGNPTIMIDEHGEQVLMDDIPTVAAEYKRLMSE